MARLVRRAGDTTAPADPGDDFAGDAPLRARAVIAQQALREDPRLLRAATAYPYLAEGLLREDVLALLDVRPSLLDDIARSPRLLKVVLELPGLPGVMAQEDKVYRVLLDDRDIGRVLYQEEALRAVKANPEFVLAFVNAKFAMYYADAADARALIMSSAVAARAVAADAEVFQTLRSPGLAGALGETGSEEVIRAATARNGRLQALAENPGLIGRLRSAPRVAATLAAHEALVPDAPAMDFLLRNQALLERLNALDEETRLVALRQPVLAAAGKEPGFLQVLAAAPTPEARARLTTPSLLSALTRNGDVTEWLTASPRREALGLLVRSPDSFLALLNDEDTRSALMASPDLVTAMHRHPQLLAEAGRRSKAWQVALTHPALALELGRSVYGKLENSPAAADRVIAMDGPLDGEGAGRLASALQRPGVVSLLGEEALRPFAEQFLRRPAWQELASRVHNFASGVRALHRDGEALRAILAAPDDRPLRDALEGSAERPAAPRTTAAPVTPRTGDDAPAQARAVRETRPEPPEPEARGTGRDPVAAELRVLRDTQPDLYDWLAAHPEEQWRTRLDHSLPTAEALTDPARALLDGKDFHRHFDEWSALVDHVQRTPAEGQALRDAALDTWNEALAGRYDEAAELLERRVLRMREFRPGDHGTWHFSGRFTLLADSRLVPSDFSAADETGHGRGRAR
ncbi:hypothetical protein [Streptomyces sp. NPDC005498]|uniref:hypothetical protein n=1 Tax=Streptomyces sp. NPDC005498 TaxID=3364717 RepID=UPI0036B1E635